jgi:hypothetical protein
MNKLLCIFSLFIFNFGYCLGSSLSRSAINHLLDSSHGEELTVLLRYHRYDSVDLKDKQGRTVLFYAKYPESIALLVNAKVDIDHQDVDGETALSNALLNSNSSMKLIRGLVGARANPWVRTNGKSVIERFTFDKECQGVDSIYFDDKNLGYIETSTFKDRATRGEEILITIRAAAV